MDYYINLPNSIEKFQPAIGTFLYYCYRKLPVEKQRQLMIIEHLQYHMINTCELYNEPTVAIKKLHWWQNEIKKVFDGQPNHPTALAFQSLVNQIDVNKDNLIQTITAKNKLLLGTVITEDKEINDLIQEQYSYFEVLKARVLSNHQPLTDQVLNWVHNANIIMEKIRFIYVIKHHKHNQLYLINTITDQTSHEEQALILKKQADQLLQHYFQLKKNLPNKQMQPLANRLILHIKILKAMKKNQFNVEKQRVELTPLQMLFSTK